MLCSHTQQTQSKYSPSYTQKNRPTSPYLSPTHVNSSIFTSPGLNTSYTSRIKTIHLDQTLLTQSENYLRPIRSEALGWAQAETYMSNPNKFEPNSQPQAQSEYTLSSPWSNLLQITKTNLNWNSKPKLKIITK